MLDLPRIIESIESLAYNLLMWVLLVPKTLAKIVFHPTWAPGYVAVQLKGDSQKRFDDFVSPIILIFLATLMPFAYANVTPPPGVSVLGDAQTDINKNISLMATANFISKNNAITYEWGEWVGDQQQTWGTWNSDQTTDYVTISWSTPGWKTVYVNASNNQGESYYYEMEIYVIDPGQSVADQGVGANAPAKTGNGPSTFRSFLESGIGLLAALGFLSVPLLFALVIELLRGNPLSGSSLMRSFYIECYYLSPFALAAWSFILGVEYFITPNQWPLILLSGAVVLVMLIWLIRNEMLLFAAELRLHRMSAMGIVLGCIVLVVAVAIAAYLLQGNAEAYRQLLDWFYVIFVAGLVITGFWHNFFRKRAAKEVDKAK